MDEEIIPKLFNSLRKHLSFSTEKISRRSLCGSFFFLNDVSDQPSDS